MIRHYVTRHRRLLMMLITLMPPPCAEYFAKDAYAASAFAIHAIAEPPAIFAAAAASYAAYATILYYAIRYD